MDFLQFSKATLANADSGNPYFSRALALARSWVNGQRHFSLTTSGSTGKPKEITLEREQMMASAQATFKALGLSADTRALVCLNIHFVAGLMMIIRGMQAEWLLMVIEPVSNPLSGLPNNFSFDFAALVPLQLEAIFENEGTRVQIDRLGTILLGGAPVSDALMHRIQTLNQPVYQGYGMTETVSHIALRRLDNNQAPADYVALPGVELKTDARGCLLIRAASTLGKPVITNDLAELTSPSTFRLLGRIDNVINSGGLKIHLEKIEETVSSVLPKIKKVSAFFAWFEADDSLGQKLCVIVEGKPDLAQEKELKQQLAQKLPPHEMPKNFYYINRFLTTASGKIDKNRTAQSILPNKTKA